MNDEIKNKIAALNFENLSEEIEGFTLKKIFAADEDKFIFFSYVDQRLDDLLSRGDAGI